MIWSDIRKTNTQTTITFARVDYSSSEVNSKNTLLNFQNFVQKNSNLNAK